MLIQSGLATRAQHEKHRGLLGVAGNLYARFCSPRLGKSARCLCDNLRAHDVVHVQFWQKKKKKKKKNRFPVFGSATGYKPAALFPRYESTLCSAPPGTQGHILNHSVCRMSSTQFFFFPGPGGRFSAAHIILPLPLAAAPLPSPPVFARAKPVCSTGSHSRVRSVQLAVTRARVSPQIFHRISGARRGNQRSHRISRRRIAVRKCNVRFFFSPV